MRIWAVIAVVAAVACGYLGYRVLSLEARVDRLSKQLGVPAEGSGGEQAAQPVAAPTKLAVIERELHALRDDLRTLEEATGNVPQAAQEPGGEQRILSVVEREQTRLRDRQLEFHQGRWLKLRESSLETFAEQHGLSQRQVDQLYVLLADEVDQMTDLMRRKEVQEDPEKASSDLLALLEETDRAALRVLTQAQLIPWESARTFERRVLWPWLPFEKSTKK